MNTITLLFTYYNCPEMLAKQVEYWSDYSKEVIDNVRIIVIDDGSKCFPAKDVLNNIKSPRVDLYRIKKDIFQNTMGARNLGFKLAKEGWCINLDIDHVIPSESLEQLINANLNPSCYYLPARFRMETLTSSEKIYRHSDTFIITRKMFWRIGGYNEDYVKYYYNGASFMFRKELAKNKRVEIEDVWTLYFSPFVVSDASPIQKRIRKQGPAVIEKGTNPIRFEWEKVILQQDYENMPALKSRKSLIKNILNDISYGEYTEKSLSEMPYIEILHIEESLSLSP